MNRRALAIILALTAAVGLAIPTLDGGHVQAHHTTITCDAPGVWLIVNSEAATAMTFTTNHGHSGSIPGGGSTTVAWSGTELTVYGSWANGVQNTSYGEGDCTDTTTTTTTTSTSTTSTTCPDCTPNTNVVTTTTTGPTTTTTTAPGSTTSTTTPTDSSTTTSTTSTTTSTPTTTPADTLDIGAASVICTRDVPYVNLTFGNQPQLNGLDGTIAFYDLDGNFVEIHTVTYQAGATIQVLYPGATVDAAGNATDWPGWLLNDDGYWVLDPTDAAWRDGLTIVASINPSATTTIGYPPETEACASPDGPYPPTPTPAGVLPATR